jgi:hypothetical protein
MITSVCELTYTFNTMTDKLPNSDTTILYPSDTRVRCDDSLNRCYMYAWAREETSIRVVSLNPPLQGHNHAKVVNDSDYFQN